MEDRIIEKYRQAPGQSGVYLMKDKNGGIIYVGKAKNLKKRLSSYFIKKENHDPKTASLIETIHDFQVITTAGDHEAFILESNLIKEHSPKYNVILKDGKNYPLLRIDMSKPYPAIERVRQIKKDNALYFGPYSSSYSVNRTLKNIQKIFRLRQCRDTQFRNRTRPCLNFQIKACLGLCCNDVPEEEYRKRIHDAVLFLRGKSEKVVTELTKRMKDFSEALEYEKAADIRDTITAIKRTMEKQIVVSPDMQDRDIVACTMKKGRAVIAVMVVRTGYLIDTSYYHPDPGLKSEDEVLSAFLAQYYSNHQFLPLFILLNLEIENREFLQSEFTRARGRKVSITVPERGEKKRLVEMAQRNADQELEKKIVREEQQQAALVMLQGLFKMERVPSRIECFDNSNLAGHDPVASMVVFRDGAPSREDYRKYIIRGIEFQDDYAYMYQVLERRFSKSTDEMPYPDLLVVDGGKGQLSMAVSVLNDLNLSDRFMVAGLAKKNEAKKEESDKIYVPGRSNPLNTSSAKKALYLLEQVRDEAHRFAVTFQRKRREKRAGLSGLDLIPGIGPKKKQMLLRHFKGTSRIKSAAVEELIQLPGINRTLAETIIRHLNS